ncbi:Retrovirus-related Pol polyprotein from transposon 17.6, partial [Mucuna pruriens]
MCDASNFALGVVLGQRVGIGQPMHQNYATIEKELLAIVFALYKFCSYLLGSKIIVFSDHAALRFLLKKPDAKPRLIRWILLLQEFDIEIRDEKGAKNPVADHLSRIRKESEPMPIRDEFSYEQLLHFTTPTPWFVDVYNFVVASQFPPEASQLYKEKLRSDAKYYIWDDPYLWRLCSDQIIRRSNRAMSSLLHKYGVIHGIATAYHPQTNGEAEVFNREIKKTLQKMTNSSRKDWSRILEDALWAHITAYRTSLGMFRYQIIFGKACHLLNIELTRLSNSATWPMTKLDNKGSFNCKS